MKMKFPVYISNGANTSVTIDLTTEQSNEILKNSLSNIPFSENETISALYTMILDEAYNQLVESIKTDQAFLNYFLAGKFNFPRAKEVIQEMFSITVDYPVFE